MLNEILLRRKCKLVGLDTYDEDIDNLQYVLAMAKNIENLGYSFSPNLINVLKTHSIRQLQDIYLQLKGMIENIVGYKEYKPMYPNFPEQVMDESEIALYLNQIKDC